MSSPTRLILVRHGEAECNTRDIWHGWDDCSLTARGLEQAEAVGRRLAGESIAAVYSSPSRRAFQTATAIAQPHGLAPIVDERLRERHAGDFEGRVVTDVVSERPTVWEERDADLWGWSPPGGESFRQVLARVREVVERVQREHSGETVVLATHMGPVRMLVSDLAGIPIEETYRMTFPSTGVTIFRLDGEIARLEALNDAAHVS